MDSKLEEHLKTAVLKKNKILNFDEYNYNENDYSYADYVWINNTKCKISDIKNIVFTTYIQETMKSYDNNDIEYGVYFYTDDKESNNNRLDYITDNVEIFAKFKNFGKWFRQKKFPFKHAQIKQKINPNDFIKI